MPFQPEPGQGYDGTGLALHFLLGNVTALHPGLKEFWFGWRVKKLFPGKRSFMRYCRGQDPELDMMRLGRSQGVRYWVTGKVAVGETIRVRLALTDVRGKGLKKITHLEVDLQDRLLNFRREFIGWLSLCGLPMPQSQRQKALWPEEVTREGLRLLGLSMESYYLDAFKAHSMDRSGLDKAAADAPRSYLIRDLHAWALYKNDRMAAAAREFQAALDLNPDGLGAMAGLMWCAVKAGDEKRAYDWGMKKAGLRGDDPLEARAGVANRLGNEALKKKDFQKAARLYGRAVSWHPGKMLYVKKKVDALRQSGRLEEAFETLIQALDAAEKAEDRKALLRMKDELSMGDVK